MSDSTAFRSILVPVDGSTLAEAAFPAALAIAHRSGGKVQLAMVYGDNFPPAPMRLDQSYLDRIRRQLSEPLGYEPRCELLEGPVAPTLIKHARNIGADLIVMTTHGRGGLQRTWLGSVTDQLVRSSGIPVLVVPPSPETRSTFNLGEILVPLDGSPLAETVLEPAAALARLWDAEMSLLQVVYPVPVTAGDAALTVATAYDEELTAITRESASTY